MYIFAFPKSKRSCVIRQTEGREMDIQSWVLKFEMAHVTRDILYILEDFSFIIRVTNASVDFY
jgi:hypothetical protein